MKSKLLYPNLSYKLQGCFYTVYNTLGFGHKEVIYQRALAEELKKKNIPFEKEKSLPVIYNDKKIADYRPDFLIDNKIITELKAVDFFPRPLVSQLVNYLKATRCKLGYVVNFGGPKLEIFRRIWTPDYQYSIRDNSL